MRKEALLAAAVAAGLVPGSAAARPLPPNMQEYGKPAKRMLVMPGLRDPAKFVRLKPGESYAPGAPPMETVAMAVPELNTIYSTGGMDRFTRAHELGHLFDAQVLSDGDRRYFQRLLRAGRGEWEPDYQPGEERRLAGGKIPAEVFADYFAAAVVGLDPGGKLGRDGAVHGSDVSSYGQLRPKRLKRFRRAMDRVRRRYDLPAYR